MAVNQRLGHIGDPPVLLPRHLQQVLVGDRLIAVQGVHDDAPRLLDDPPCGDRLGEVVHLLLRAIVSVLLRSGQDALPDQRRGHRGATGG